MIDTLLALVPQYGLWVIFIVVTLACLAVPLPAFFMVLAAGGFASVGDLALWAVLLTVFCAFVLGDLLAFTLGHHIGGPLLARLRRSKRAAPLIRRSEALLQARGGIAVLLSHTLLSPTCAYVTYLCGAGGLSFQRYATAALPGALIWSCGYVLIGFAFAENLEQVATILGDFLGVVLAGFIFLAALYLLRKRWKQFSARARARVRLKRRRG